VQRYYRMGSGRAAVVAEGALKPDAGVTITPVDLTLEKIAALAQFSDEMGEDAPFLVDHLTQELAAAVAQAENARIVATFGSTSGILTQAGTSATVVDAIADAISGQEAVSGLTPNAVIAAPSVVAAIRKRRPARPASTSSTRPLPDRRRSSGFRSSLHRPPRRPSSGSSKPPASPSTGVEL
jgi:HK97 family phage major capsid protein